MEQNEILNTTPTEIVAGTTVEWTLSLPHKPTDGYTCKFNLAGPSNYVTITATQSNESFVLKLVPANTTGWPTGVYSYQIVTEKAADKFFEISGQIAVNAIIGASGDNRSVAEKICDAIDALVLNRATIDQQSYQIGNRQLSRIPLDELLRIRKYYFSIVDSARRAARLKAGKSLWPSIKLKFSRS